MRLKTFEKSMIGGKIEFAWSRKSSVKTHEMQFAENAL